MHDPTLLFDTFRTDRLRSPIPHDTGADRLLLVESGELTLSCRGRTWVAPQGHLLLLCAGERVDIRGISGIGGLQVDSVRLDEPVIAGFERQHRLLLRDLADGDAPEQLVFTRSTESTLLWNHMTRSIRSQLPMAMIEHWIQGVLLQLALEGWRLPFLFRSEVPARRQVERVITRDIARDWTAADVAAALGVSEPTLRRKLAAEGTSYRMLLEDARMNQALQMLMSTSMPVSHIAHAVGYLSASRFAIRFAARYGISPRMLRSVRHESAPML